MRIAVTRSTILELDRLVAASLVALAALELLMSSSQAVTGTLMAEVRGFERGLGVTILAGLCTELRTVWILMTRLALEFLETVAS